jgi:hypothetical protein
MEKEHEESKLNTNTLQKELDALKQEKLAQHEENQLLKEKLAKMEEGIQDNANNDLNYDSSDNGNDRDDTDYDTECSDDGSTTAEMSLTEVNSGALQKELDDLKQEKHQHEKNQLLKQNLRMESGIQDNASNDSRSSDNENNNDINYDTECSDDEKENANITQNNPHSVEVFADPNYNSSDNEDPRNDIYLD